MSREDRREELGEKTQQLLQGSLKHVRAAALAAVLVPLASVAAVSPAVAQAGLCASSGCTCPASSGQTGVPYSSTLGVIRGTPPYTFSIISGTLPPGLTLDPSTGSITGTPTAAGTFDFTWEVQDSSSPPMTGTLMCEIIITTLGPSVPSPCDFITGGGFVFTDSGPQANFGSHGGCKNGEFWGHVNFVDHGGFAGAMPYHVDSTQITGYLEDDTTVPTGRDICGLATTNAGETVSFRVHMEDNGEPGVNDKFGIRLSNHYILTSRHLGNGGSGGGNIQLHKPNPSTTAPSPPPTELQMCGDMAGGILPPP